MKHVTSEAAACVQMYACLTSTSRAVCKSTVNSCNTEPVPYIKSIVVFVAEGQKNIRKRRTNVTGLMIIECLDAFCISYNTKYAAKCELYPLPWDCPQDLVNDAKKYYVTFD